MKWLKDPLLHFLLVGALLFAWFAWHHESDDRAGRIVIAEDEIKGLIEASTILSGAPPNKEEIYALVEPTIRAEIMYREALALGLDKQDAEVRKRLIEKMEYLSQDLATAELPDEADLRAFYDEHPDHFVIPVSLDLEHRFFNKRNDNPSEAAALALTELRQGAAASGDESVLFENSYTAVDQERLALVFGREVADALLRLAAGDWQEPLTSRYGVHLFRIKERNPAYQPDFAEARDKVFELYMEQKRQAANQAAYEAMRARYDIEIEIPLLEQSERKP